jgi:hypothetical protein
VDGDREYERIGRALERGRQQERARQQQRRARPVAIGCLGCFGLVVVLAVVLAVCEALPASPEQNAALRRSYAAAAAAKPWANAVTDVDAVGGALIVHTNLTTEDIQRLPAVVGSDMCVVAALVIRSKAEGTSGLVRAEIKDRTGAVAFHLSSTDPNGKCYLGAR